MYVNDLDSAGSYVADNSPAARYISHQTAVAKVETLLGNPQSVSPGDINVTSNAAEKTVKVEDSSGDTPHTYLWQDFTEKDGKISSWQVQGRTRSLDARLWHSKSSNQSKDVAATLVSAYENNSGNVDIVVEIASAEINARITGASYTPSNGYRQEDAENLLADIDSGGKTLTYFTFSKSRIGGRMKLNVDRIDANDDSSSYPYTTLSLKIS